MIKLNQKQIRRFMKMRGWKQKDLAKALDSSASLITLLLNGTRDPSRRIMDRLIDISGLSFKDLFFSPSSYQNVRQKQGNIQKGNSNAQKTRECAQ